MKILLEEKILANILRKLKILLDLRNGYGKE
jgi:hypothetical protein